MQSRVWRQVVFTFPAGSDTSDGANLSFGCFGTLIVPSTLNGSTVQLLTDIQAGPDLTAAEALAVNGASGVGLLGTAKSLVTGANPFTAAELAQIGAAGPVRLRLSSAPVAQTKVVLWWKS